MHFYNYENEINKSQTQDSLDSFQYNKTVVCLLVFLALFLIIVCLI